MWELRFYFGNAAWLPLYFKTEAEAKHAMKKWAEAPGSWFMEKDEMNLGDVFVSPHDVWFVTIVEKDRAPAPAPEDFLEPLTP